MAESLFQESIEEESTTLSEDYLLDSLPETERELLMAEILSQETIEDESTIDEESATLADDSIFDFLPETEKELLMAELLSQETTSDRPGEETCNPDDTCLGRCGGGSDLSCWCDER